MDREISTLHTLKYHMLKSSTVLSLKDYGRLGALLIFYMFCQSTNRGSQYLILLKNLIGQRRDPVLGNII